MHSERQPIPARNDLVTALEAMIGSRLAQPEWTRSKDLALARPLLTLECVGGPPIPEGYERPERLRAVRDLLKELVPRFFKLPITGFPRKFKVDSDEAREEEAAKLADAVVTIFQLNISKLDPETEIGPLRSETDAIWEMGDRWFERQRQAFAFGKLADWIIEYEEDYRKENRPPVPESDPESAAITSLGAASRSEDAPNPLEESPPPEPTGGEVADETEDGDLGDESPADLDGDRPIALASPLEPGHRLWIGRLVGGAFIAALVIGALVAALVLSAGGSERSGNPAGEIRRVLNVPAPEDLAVSGGFAWLVNANSETAIRVSEATGKRETIFVDQPPFVSEPLPGSHTHTGLRTGGYRVAAGPNGAWIVTNGGVVLAIGTTGRQVRILNPHIRILAGEPVLYRGSLWLAGFGEHLYRLRARDGVIQGEYKLLTNPFLIDNLAAGVGSIWAYNDRSGNNPKINILTPVSGRWGVKQSVLPLDHPVFDLAAGLGAVWTLNADETVTRYDPATGGSSRPIQVPGGAQTLALGQDAVWIGTGNDTAVRIDPTTLAMIGTPIPLPGNPSAIGADKNVWVATPTKLIEIES